MADSVNIIQISLREDESTVAANCWCNWSFWHIHFRIFCECVSVCNSSTYLTQYLLLLCSIRPYLYLWHCHLLVMRSSGCFGMLTTSRRKAQTTLLISRQTYLHTFKLVNQAHDHTCLSICFVLCRHIAELIFYMEELRAHVRKYGPVMQRYYVQYLSGFDAVVLNELVQVWACFLKCILWE